MYRHIVWDAMHEYDVALKAVLSGPATGTLYALTGMHIKAWKNIELPEVQNPRVDMLGETDTGALVHIELQSTNSSDMPTRMALYGLRILLRYGRFPRQVVLYIGEAPLRMQNAITLPEFAYRYKLVDIRELDGEPLLASRAIGDNIVSILTRVRDRSAAVRQVLERIAMLEPGERGVAFAELMILAGLRSMEDFIEAEAANMPILTDIRDHKVIGREYKRGEMTILRRQMAARFGAVPDWVDAELQKRGWRELEELSERLLTAPTIEELFA